MGKRLRNLLGALDVERAKPKAKPYRLADGGGLFLWVPCTGVKTWQFRYRFDGRPQTTTLGRFSKVQGLAWARGEAEAARSRAEAGEHLTRLKAIKKASKAAASGSTFGTVAADWLKSEARRAQWTAAYHEQVAASLRNHLAKLDPLPVAEISAAMVSPYLRRLEASAPDTARKVRQRVRAIFDHAVEDGLIVGNPIPATRRRRSVGERSHLPAITTRDGVGEILRKAGKAEASKGVWRAHLLAAFTAQRIGEIVPARWDEVDFQAGLLTIPRDRMKLKDLERGPHAVPLPPHLLANMREWRQLDGEEAVFICPAPRGDRHITREAVEKFYRRTLLLSGIHSPHSWRTVLSTWANDTGEDSDAVESQLDHITGGKVKAAYDRAKRFVRRAQLMTRHEASLLAARDGAKVIDFPGRSDSFASPR